MWERSNKTKNVRKKLAWPKLPINLVCSIQMRNKRKKRKNEPVKRAGWAYVSTNHTQQACTQWPSREKPKKREEKGAGEDRLLSQALPKPNRFLHPLHLNIPLPFSRIPIKAKLQPRPHAQADQQVCPTALVFFLPISNPYVFLHSKLASLRYNW